MTNLNNMSVSEINELINTANQLIKAKSKAKVNKPKAKPKINKREINKLKKELKELQHQEEPLDVEITISVVVNYDYVCDNALDYVELNQPYRDSTGPGYLQDVLDIAYDTDEVQLSLDSMKHNIYDFHQKVKTMAKKAKIKESEIWEAIE